MRLKADENLPQSVVKLLRDGGHDVHPVLDENLGGSSDAALLSAARHENRALPLLSTTDLAGRLWIVDERRIRVR
jgi:hypothetical protein